jgi:shikimate kinase
MYNERAPLYESYADTVISLENTDISTTLEQILNIVRE